MQQTPPKPFFTACRAAELLTEEARMWFDMADHAEGDERDWLASQGIEFAQLAQQVTHKTNEAMRSVSND